MNTVIRVGIEDLQVQTIPDQGFFTAFDDAPTMHSHAYFELLLAMEGDFYLELPDGKRRSVAEGGFCLIAPTQYHATRGASPDSKKLGIRFLYDRCDEADGAESVYLAFDAALKEGGALCISADGAPLCRLAWTLRREMQNKDVASGAYVRTVLTQMYVELMRLLRKECAQATIYAATETVRETDARRLWLEEYLYEHYAEPLTERQVAEAMHLSTRQLNRVTGQIWGAGFRQLLVEMRLNRAAQQLLQTDRSVEQIAYDVGYTSLSGFYTAFAKQFGCTAGKYRKKQKN